MLYLPKNKLYLWIGGGVAVVLLGVGVIKLATRTIDINNGGLAKISGQAKNQPTSQLTGVPCAEGERRPFALMVSSDPEARPLSGIGEADWVFEMPVVDTGFTRMMVVFQCGRPKEVGSIRSSRLDFVPLAQGMNAIYAHFGGEKEALAELNSGVIDNIDGLKYDGTYYYRKSNIARPHNAFTDFERLIEVATKLNYQLTDGKVVYPHNDSNKSQGELNPPAVFNAPFAVEWHYDKTGNIYYRYRGGTAEVDKSTGKTVAAKNVAILKTTWSPINKDYIRVKTVGTGGLLLYKNGTVVTGTWEKKDDRAKLYFYDQNHKEIPLTVGSVWVEIDAR